MKTDFVLQQDVIDELFYGPNLGASNIGVMANDDVITLTGTVPSYPGRYAAERAAERVAGVRAVADETKVSLPSLHKRSDPDIASAALNAMSWQVRIPMGSIQVRVGDGWVMLDGSVDFNFEREAAENAVRHLTGVIAVNNLITLKATVSAFDMKKDIESAFERAAHVGASHIGLNSKWKQSCPKCKSKLVGGTTSGRAFGVGGSRCLAGREQPPDHDLRPSHVVFRAGARRVKVFISHLYLTIADRLTDAVRISDDVDAA